MVLDHDYDRTALGRNMRKPQALAAGAVAPGSTWNQVR
jgi:hypothetical protein